MCGIIGRVSIKNDPLVTLNGLKELEYRGYDSYGILINEKIFKDIGEISTKEIDKLKSIQSNIEIGHTRWATHGGVFQNNAHPHTDYKKKFFIVMNGIVENYQEVKEELIEEGIIFNSETDTEVIVQLFSKLFDGDLIFTLKNVLKKLKGEFSFLLKYENIILGYKNINPIIVGSNNDEIFIASDLNLVQKNVSKFYVMEDREFFVCEKLENEINLKIYNKNYELIEVDFMESKVIEEDEEINYEYVMEKEILESKKLNKLLSVENLKNIYEFIFKLEKRKNIVLTGAGTSYNAALYMHYTLLELGFNSQYIIASELTNYINVISDSLIVVFSQSGETADLIYPLREMKENNEIFAIVNTENSTVDRIAKTRIYLNCGIEKGVASTKAFTFQIGISKIIFFKIKNKDIVSKFKMFENDLEKCLNDNKLVIDEIVDRFYTSKDFFFIGRNKYYPLAIEGALKLKEISYIHAEGFAGGELKHGTLALIEKDIGCVVVGEETEIISNACEIKTRGGVIIGISENFNSIFDYHLSVPNYLKCLFMNSIMQKLALKMALKIGNNPDKPRNLAKSVTVK